MPDIMCKLHIENADDHLKWEVVLLILDFVFWEDMNFNFDFFN